jgi:hypothetical protein
MRAGFSIGAGLGLACSLVLLGIVPGRTDETFLCADGTNVTMESGNRAAMEDHPCVKAWFADDLARRRAQAAGEDGECSKKTRPTVYRHTVLRAMALRDLQKRPAYLAWAHARTVDVRTYTRGDGTVVKSHLRSLPSERPRANFRGRFGRR